MKYTFAELVDIDKVQKLMESYCQAIGIASAIIDFDGNVLVGTNWQPLCTDFHRVNEESCKMCLESDTVLANRLQQGETYTFYECRNGLLDAATPIIIDGEHLVNLFVGQFLMEPPDQDYFREQARRYDFELPQYMAALAQVPVISREKAEDALDFMAQFATTLGEMGLQQKRQLEHAARLETEIAERRRVEQELRKLSRAVEQSANTVVITDTKGNIEYVNPKFCETTGYSRDEAIGQHTRILKSGETSSEEYQELWQTITAGREWQGEFHNKRKNGELYWEMASISPIKDEAGNITHFLAVKEDITARKTAEAALRESEARYSAVVEQSHDGIVIIQENLCQFANQTLADMLGYAAGELEGTPFVNYLAPESRELVAARVKARLAGEDVPSVYEARLLRKDGTTFDAELSAGIIQYRGEVADVGLIRDITERKQAEQALRESEERFRTIYESTNDAVMLLTPQGFFDCNTQTVELFGFDTKEEFTAVHPAHVSPPFQPDGRESMPAAMDRIQMAYQQGHHRFEWVHRRTNGEDFPAEVLLTAFELGGETVLQATVRDITERKHLEGQIQKLLDRRERQMGLSIEVAQETAVVAKAEALYGRIATSVMQHLACSHVQLYRYNPVLAAAMIVAGDGDIGRQRLAEDHQVPLGQGSVGAALATGSSVLRSDVSTDAVWLSDPSLPEVKSELVVPIKLGGEDGQAQARGLNYFVEADFDGLAVIAVDRAAVEPVAKTAVNSGLKVTAIHTDLGPGNQTSMVQISNREMGYNLGIQAGLWAREHLPAGQTLKLGLLNYPYVPEVAEREEGIIEGIKAKFGDNFEIVGREPAGDPGQGLPIAERWLASHPDLQMILGINDGGALGAHRAVIAADKDDPESFFVGGIDATPEGLAAIQRGGAYQATVDIKPTATGVLVVRMLVAAIKGKRYPQVSLIQSAPVNRTDLEAFLGEDQVGPVLPDALQLEEELQDLDLSDVRVGLSVLNLNNPFIANMVGGAREEAARLGIELVVNDPKQILGALVVQSDAPGALDSEDQLTLEGLSAQLSTAFESLRLLEEANTFRQFVEASGQGFGMATLEGEIVYANPALLQLLEMEKLEDMVGQPIVAYYTEKEQQVIQTEILPALMETGQWAGEMMLQSTKGRLTPTLENYFLIRDDQGQPQYVADVITDITDRKQTEAELESRLNELHTLQRLMTREGWQEFAASRTQAASGYLFDQAAVRPVEQDELDVSANGQEQAEAAADRFAGHKAVTKPLAVSGESIGTLGIYEDDPDNPLSPEDQAFLDEVANQVAEALERARLLEQSRTSLAETEALLTGSERVMQATTMQDILEAVVTSTALQKLDRIQLLFFDHPWDDQPPEFMTLTSFWRRRDEPTEFPVGAEFALADFSTTKYFDREKPSIFTDLSTDPRVDEKTRAFLVGQIGMQGLVDFPLVGGGQWLGILHGDADTPLDLTEEEIRQIGSLIDLAASVIQNQRLFEETQQALAEVEATQRRYTVQAWEAYRGKRRATSYEEEREGVPPLGEQLPPEVSRVVAEKKPLAITADSNGQEPELLTGEAKASLTVPLTVRDELIGVLGLQNIAEAKDWTPEEVVLVEAIAEQVALAAEQIRLFDETQQRAAREQRVGEIGDKIRAAQTLEEALQVAIKEVGLTLKAPQTRVELGVE